jgi:hypothetical protein
MGHTFIKRNAEIDEELHNHMVHRIAYFIILVNKLSYGQRLRSKVEVNSIQTYCDQKKKKNFKTLHVNQALCININFI